MIQRKCGSAMILAAAIAAWTPLAHAQSNKAAAAALFDEGRAALQRNELDIACAKFKESDRLDPAIGTTFNLANCEEQRGHLATASALFRQAAARMQAEDQRLPIANARTQSLASRVPHLVFAASSGVPAGTRIRLDDMELDLTSAGSPIPLDPGRHQAIIRSPGRPPRSLEFSLAPAETLTLAVDAPQTASAHEDHDDRVLGMKRTDAILASAAIGGAGLLVATITGIIGLNAQVTGNNECSSLTRTCTQTGHDANQRAKTMAIISSTGFIITLLGGGAATYLYVTTPSTNDSTRAAMLGVVGTW